MPGAAACTCPTTRSRSPASSPRMPRASWPTRRAWGPGSDGRSSTARSRSPSATMTWDSPERRTCGRAAEPSSPPAGCIARSCASWSARRPRPRPAERSSRGGARPPSSCARCSPADKVDRMPDALALLVALAVGYVVGSLPLARRVGLAAGVDPLTQGERNPGSANVWKLAGPRAGLVALAADLGKGLVPALAGRVLVTWAAGWAAGLGAILGHAWPSFGRLAGGRAIATFSGACIGLEPIAGLSSVGICLATLLTARAVGRRGRVAAIAAGVGSFPMLAWLGDPELARLVGILVLYLVTFVRYVATRPHPAASTR